MLRIILLSLCLAVCVSKILPVPTDPICQEGYVYCFVAPCQVTHCPTHPSAECRDNYCGGCNAEFYDENGNLLTDC